MDLDRLAKVAYMPGTASEHIHISVRVYSEGTDKNKLRELWSGEAKDLQNSNLIGKGWLVVEMLIDDAYRPDVQTPGYNKGKILTVI